MENQPKLNGSKEIIVFLAERFPLCFTVTGVAHPLKIGIFQDLAANIQEEMNISKTQLRSALRFYTSGWRYLRALKNGEQRIDLDGLPCDIVDQQHAEYASMQLQKAKARVQVQRAEQQAKKCKTPVVSTETPSTAPPVAAATAVSTGAVLQARQPTQPKPRTIVEKKQVCSLSAIDIAKLRIGQDVKIMAGKDAMEATVLEIARYGIRVQLSSGLAMIVRAEHLQF